MGQEFGRRTAEIACFRSPISGLWTGKTQRLKDTWLLASLLVILQNSSPWFSMWSLCMGWFEFPKSVMGGSKQSEVLFELEDIFLNFIDSKSIKIPLCECCQGQIKISGGNFRDGKFCFFKSLNTQKTAHILCDFSSSVKAVKEKKNKAALLLYTSSLSSEERKQPIIWYNSQLKGKKGFINSFG